MLTDLWKWEPLRLQAGKATRYAWPQAVDVFHADGIGFKVQGGNGAPLKLRVTLYPLQNGRPEFIEKTQAQLLLPPEDGLVEIPFALFDFPKMVRAHLRYIAAMELELCGADAGAEILLTAAGAVRTGDLLIDSEGFSRAGEPGEKLVYRVSLRNGQNARRFLQLHADCYGREILSWEYPEGLVLEPLEEREIALSAVMLAAMPPAGHEERRFTLLDGGKAAASFSLFAARKRSGPFLLHTQSQWSLLREKIAADPALQAVFDQAYRLPAEAWEVPAPAQNPGYVYAHPSQDRMLGAAIAWKLTGNQTYLAKVQKYMEGLLDPEKGYFSTRQCYFQFPKSPEECPPGLYDECHACNAGWVQEAEFMARLAMAYDLCRDSLPLQIHPGMERLMRHYMAFEDWRLTDGDGNNFQICEASASLYFAMILQDEPLIRRFLGGLNGLYDLMGAVFSDDGSYFEGATGYMKLAAEVLGRAAVACQNGGVNLKDALVPAAYDAQVLHAPWSLRQETAPDRKPFLGMRFDRFEPVQRPVRRLKDYYDALLQLLDENGILFSANDSNEHDFTGVMQLAYYLYPDPAYLPLARKAAQPNLLFGLHMPPLDGVKKAPGSFLNRGNGFALLRQGDAQAVLKFGQHGGYHGHYDRLSLLSFLRGGKTWHNNEYTWYGYDSFLFKMWVQASVAHNMVVVDGRMQEPTPCEIVYWQEDGAFSAVCAQTAARWCDPPYGGQTPYLARFPEEKCQKEGRYILPPAVPRPQGDIGDYSEPVFQRRLVVLAEGRCFVWDYLEAEEDHTFDCLYHPLGGLRADLPPMESFTPRLFDDPFGAGQFVTDCRHYHLSSPAALFFTNERRRVNGNDAVDFVAHTALFAAWPPRQEMILGRYPERTDTFAQAVAAPDPGMLPGPGRKTVAFRQRGRRACFVTLLEIGDAPSPVCSFTADSFESVRLRLRDGSERLLTVTGMDRRERPPITVHYTRQSPEGKNQ